jgi:hypothetical protein
MLDALKFASSAVGKRAFVEGTTHFLIKEGMVRATNGVIAMAAPIPLSLECAPQAIPMLKAIANCESATQLTMLANGKLNIKSGAFKANIPCTDKIGAHVDPEGEMYEINGAELITALKTVGPFIGSDASRRFSMSVLIKGGSAFATNNVCLAQYWFGSPFPLDVVLSSDAVEALVKIKETPVRAQVTENSITFHYESGCWMRSTLMENGWPVQVEKMLSQESNPQTIDPTLFDALEKLKPFATDNGRVYIENGVVRTHADETEGASYNMQSETVHGIYALEMLMLLKNNVDTADLTLYPNPCTFFGKNFRGILVGQRP